MENKLRGAGSIHNLCVAGFELQESQGQLNSPERDSSSPESNKKL